MQLHNYFYMNGVPYEHLSLRKQTEIDKLIQRIRLDHLYERISLYQDHFFNIIQDRSQKKFESDLPNDLTQELVNAYLKTIKQNPSAN